MALGNALARFHRVRCLSAQKAPVQHITLRAIPKSSGSIPLLWDPIRSMWRVDHTQPTGYDEPEIDLGGDL
jgi:hypothetical protein